MVRLKCEKSLLNDSFFERLKDGKFSSIFFPQKRQATERLREFPKLELLRKFVQDKEESMGSLELFIKLVGRKTEFFNHQGYPKFIDCFIMKGIKSMLTQFSNIINSGLVI